MSLDISHHSSNKEYPDASRLQSFQTLKREALLRKGKSQENLNVLDRKMHLTILREEISRMQNEIEELNGRQPGVGSEPDNYEATVIFSSESNTIDEEKESNNEENSATDGKTSKDETNKIVKGKEEDVISRCNSWLDRGLTSSNLPPDNIMSKSATFSPNMEPLSPEFEVKRSMLILLPNLYLIINFYGSLIIGFNFTSF